MNKNLLLIFIFLCRLITSCEKVPPAEEKFPSEDFIKSGNYLGEYWPTTTWRTCSPGKVGMDEKTLKDLNDEIVLMLRLHVDIHSLLIIRKGYIVAEQYYSDDYGQDSIHTVYSCTKSITSAAMGIAIQEGYIADVEQKVLDFFPEYIPENPDSLKDKITIRNLLTMSSGLEWTEEEYTYNDSRNTFNEWMESDDLVKFVLDRPMAHSPGTSCDYSTGSSHLLSAIIERSVGMKTDSFVQKKIFAPLAITEYYWARDKNGIPYGGNGLRLKPRDMAKFGYLYLKDGQWESGQVIQREWIEESLQPYFHRKYIPDYYYGYQWWVSENEYFAAVGYGGQWIYVIPEYDLVVVYTGMLDEEEFSQISAPERLLQTYILPSVKNR
jgi:CubicO group peptidase (beta-lactamase class C family)